MGLFSVGFAYSFHNLYAYFLYTLPAFFQLARRHLDTSKHILIHFVSMPKEPRNEIRVTMPRELYRRIARAAKDDKRTVRAWTLIVITAHLDSRKDRAHAD